MIYENTLNPTAVLFREDQLFSRWVYLIMGVVALKLIFPGIGFENGLNGLQPSDDPRSYFVLTILGGIVASLLKMSTEVSATSVTVSFGWIPLFRTGINLQNIRSIEPCTYRPLRDTLGWGVRRSWRGETVLSARGSRAVRIVKDDGTVILIGSQKPDELAGVIESARRSLIF